MLLVWAFLIFARNCSSWVLDVITNLLFWRLWWDTQQVFFLCTDAITPVPLVRACPILASLCTTQHLSFLSVVCDNQSAVLVPVIGYSAFALLVCLLDYPAFLLCTSYMQVLFLHVSLVARMRPSWVVDVITSELALTHVFFMRVSVRAILLVFLLQKPLSLLWMYVLFLCLSTFSHHAFFSYPNVQVHPNVL